jgi:hypothetical protein
MTMVASPSIVKPGTPPSGGAMEKPPPSMTLLMIIDPGVSEAAAEVAVSEMVRSVEAEL